MRLFVCVLALSVGGCLCSGPPNGECTGTWGGQSFDKALVDLTSKMVIVNKTSCLDQDLHRYQVSWKERAITFDATTKRGPSILSSVTEALPPDAGSRFITFSFTPNPPETTGSVELGITGVQGRRTGVFALSNATESLTCSFEVPYESEGQTISCSSGDADFD